MSPLSLPPSPREVKSRILGIGQVRESSQKAYRDEGAMQRLHFYVPLFANKFPVGTVDSCGHKVGRAEPGETFSCERESEGGVKRGYPLERHRAA